MNKWFIPGMLALLLTSCGGGEEIAASDQGTTTSVVLTTAVAETITTTSEPTTTLATTTVPEVTTAAPMTADDYKTLKVNEQGHIMVVMYHGIMDNPPYHRLKEDFIKDMTFMYDHGYRLISMENYLSGHIDVPAGMTPIVFTFDDGLESTFSLNQDGGSFTVNPETAIGLMESFYEQHPDFGRDASLYIHATESNFPGAGTDTERLTWLVENGYTIGNHSATHANFKHLGKEALLKEVGAVEVYLAEALPGYELSTLTYPFGARPDSSLLPLLQNGTYEGLTLDYKVAFREGPSGQFYPSVHKKFSSLNTPRVRGSEGEVQDLWWFLEYYEENPSLKYISDGNPETIVVPLGKEENLAADLSASFEIITYEK